LLAALPVGEARLAVDYLGLGDADIALDHPALYAGVLARALAPVDVEAAAVAVEHAGVAGADADVGGDADVVGHEQADAADAHVGRYRRAPGRRFDLGEVEPQLADAELVAVIELSHG